MDNTNNLSLYDKIELFKTIVNINTLKQVIIVISICMGYIVLGIASNALESRALYEKEIVTNSPVFIYERDNRGLYVFRVKKSWVSAYAHDSDTQVGDEYIEFIKKNLELKNDDDIEKVLNDKFSSLSSDRSIITLYPKYFIDWKTDLRHNGTNLDGAITITNKLTKPINDLSVYVAFTYHGDILYETQLHQSKLNLQTGNSFNLFFTHDISSLLEVADINRDNIEIQVGGLRIS